jgi:lipid-binding SYLF domain-containing protein
MTRLRLAESILVQLTLAVATLHAGDRQSKTVDSAVAVAEAFASAPRLLHVPPAILADARGVAVIPHVVKAGVIVDRCFGRGVLLVRGPDGSWSHPVFVTLEGGGIGLDVGVEATDVVLVFKSEKSMEHILQGKGQLTLGSDVAVAVGPLGREAEKSAELWKKSEVFCYSHTRGLFAGLTLEGDKLRVDTEANEAFYHLHGGHPADVLAIHGPSPVAGVERLREHFARMCIPPTAPAYPGR